MGAEGDVADIEVAVAEPDVEMASTEVEVDED